MMKKTMIYQAVINLRSSDPQIMITATIMDNLNVVSCGCAPRSFPVRAGGLIRTEPRSASARAPGIASRAPGKVRGTLGGGCGLAGGSVRMSWFDAPAQFGRPMPPPAPTRPRRAVFVVGRVPTGSPFCLWWRACPGAVGFHIFRSAVVRQLGARRLARLWSGELADAVQHFAVGEQVGVVLDDFEVRGATVMGYWVLAQLADGQLVPVVDLAVGAPDARLRRRRHVVLQPGVSIPAIEAGLLAATQPQSERRDLRPAGVLRYTAPATFRLAEPLGAPVDHFTVWLGTAEPPPLAQDAMWDDETLDDNPLARFTLGPDARGFRDDLNAPGDAGCVAVMAVWRDGRVVQVGVEEGAPGPGVVGLG